jgi:hypothetical protein
MHRLGYQLGYRLGFFSRALRVTPRVSGRMNSYTTSSMASPFTKAVVNSMRKLYPESLADKSFDNTGREQRVLLLRNFLPY